MWFKLLCIIGIISACFGIMTSISAGVVWLLALAVLAGIFFICEALLGPARGKYGVWVS